MELLDIPWRRRKKGIVFLGKGKKKRRDRNDRRKRTEMKLERNLISPKYF